MKKSITQTLDKLFTDQFAASVSENHTEAILQTVNYPMPNVTSIEFISPEEPISEKSTSDTTGPTISTQLVLSRLKSLSLWNNGHGERANATRQKGGKLSDWMNRILNK